jgi:hypothetical protein
LLDNTQLGPNPVSIVLAVPTGTSDNEIATRDQSVATTDASNGHGQQDFASQSNHAQPLQSENGDRADGGAGNHGSIPSVHHFSQSDKPRTRILAEYLAHGYHLSDRIIEKGIALDKTHGFTAKFNDALKKFNLKFNDFDTKHNTSKTARQVNQEYRLTQQIEEACNSIDSYFDKALDTPTGHKLRRFYDEFNKEVHDVHVEARHLADMIPRSHHHKNDASLPAYSEEEKVQGNNQINLEDKTFK